jgi:hypothetical protein
MGLLLIRLWEARRGHRSRRLRHLTVLEEAHRILPAESAGAADPLSGGGGDDFAAETFTNLLAEVRAAGEGLLISEQSPNRLADGAVTNTGLKVALRTMGAADRDILGAALNLDDDQQQALTSFDPHEALVFWAGMDQPVRIRADAAFPPEGEPPAAGPQPAARPVIGDPLVDRLADLLLRVTADETEGVRAALLERAQAALPAPLQDRADEVVRATVEDAAERLGRARALPPRTREAIVDAALAHPPRGTLLPLPDDGCACDGSGAASSCPLRELVEQAVADWRGEGRDPAEIDRFTTPGQMAAHLRLRLTEAVGTDCAPRALDQGVACLAAHALRGTRPQAQVREVVAELPTGADTGDNR